MIQGIEYSGGTLVNRKRNGENNMPLVEISCPPLPQDAKNRLAKKITEIIADEEKKAFKIDTTGITLVAFHDIPAPNIYLATQPLTKVLQTLPKA